MLQIYRQLLKVAQQDLTQALRQYASGILQEKLRS